MHRQIVDAHCVSPTVSDETHIWLICELICEFSSVDLLVVLDLHVRYSTLFGVRHAVVILLGPVPLSDLTEQPRPPLSLF